MHSYRDNENVGDAYIRYWSNDILLWNLEEGSRGDGDFRNVIREVTMDDFAE